MKLLLTGGGGFVAKEIIRQSLLSDLVTSLVILTRSKIDFPQGLNVEKVKQVIIEDYERYSEEVRKEFRGLDACIWTVAITPNKAKAYPWAEVRRINETCPMEGLKAMCKASPAKPFRFLYMSGSAAVRDPSRKPLIYGDYSVSRGAAEVKILEIAGNYPGVEASVAKPGLINSPSPTLARSMLAAALKGVGLVGSIGVDVVAAAMLQQTLHGFESDELSNNDLSRIGATAMAKD